MKTIIKSFNNKKGKAVFWREDNNYCVSVSLIAERGVESIPFKRFRQTSNPNIERFDPDFVNARVSYYSAIKKYLK